MADLAGICGRVRRVFNSRRALLSYWEGRCPLTGVTEPALLRASHIVPWAECANDAERLDVQDGAREEARLWRMLRGGSTDLELDEDGEGKGKGKEKEMVEGKGREREKEVSGRKSGLVNLDPDWRDYVQYYGEWEVAEEDRWRAKLGMGSNSTD